MTKEEALEVSRATAELLSNLGNQLRSPVSEIRNLTSVRLALAAIEDETEYLRKVHRSREFLFILVTEILASAKTWEADRLTHSDAERAVTAEPHRPACN